MTMGLKDFLKRHGKFLSIISYIYNLPIKLLAKRLHVRLKISGSFLKHCKLESKGKGNAIIIGGKGRLSNCTIYFSGDNNTLSIGGGHTIVANTTFWLQGKNCVIKIGKDFTMEGGGISVTENGEIHIGNDCMFSFGIDIRNGDSHTILDMEGNRLNKAKDISIKDHVWLGANVTVLKGISIESNSIIGTRSIVCKNCTEAHSIYAGAPARFIKSGVDWNRKLID